MATVDLPLDSADPPFSGPVRDWFAHTFPAGPTPAQVASWPIITARENLLLISPTGTGKTLAGFLAVIDRLIAEHLAGSLDQGKLRCVYVSPLRSLGYDIERSLVGPLDAIRRQQGWRDSPIRVGVRTGDTTPYQRQKLRSDPPHLLITTPESLSLLLSQKVWDAPCRPIDTIVVDEIHALAGSKRGADLAVTLERLAGKANCDPARIGLSATCRPPEPVAHFLVGPERTCRIVTAPWPPGTPPLRLDVESLLHPDEGPSPGMTYRRIVRRLREVIDQHRTTVVFANTRAFTEKLTHDLRNEAGAANHDSIAAHHSALDAERRRVVESQLKAGDLKAVITSTSLELGVDIGQADLSVLLGLPGSVARCLQRVGRAGHAVGVQTKGLILAGTAAELVGAIVTAEAARAEQVEPIQPIVGPLDVVCQQLIGMAAGGEWSADEAFTLLRRSAPMAELSRADFDDCLQFLAGELSTPAGAFEPEPGSAPKWTSPRIWKKGGLFGIRNSRVTRWFWSNVGTILSEESVRVQVGNQILGTLEGAYADRLAPGDRFVLDGRALEYLRSSDGLVHAEISGKDANLPRWTSDRMALSPEMAQAVAEFRWAASQLLNESPSAFRAALADDHDLGPDEVGVLENLFHAQDRVSEVPGRRVALVESWWDETEAAVHLDFHAPLGRPACEAMARACASRLGGKYGRNLALTVADLGWSLVVPEVVVDPADLPSLFDLAHFDEDVLTGVDRGELLSRRFRHVAATALMVLRRPEGGKVKVGGLNWVSQRLYPLVQAACPRHPLLRETRREVLEDVLDTRTARAWLAPDLMFRHRALDGPSPFALTWVLPNAQETLSFESPSAALRRLHDRLVAQ